MESIFTTTAVYQWVVVLAVKSLKLSAMRYSAKLNIEHMAHMLDNFLLLDRDKGSLRAKLAAFLSMCEDIGVPIAPDKTVEPTRVITFLGFEIDSIAMELRLPLDKLKTCKLNIASVVQKDKIQLRRLQSIIVMLNFACGAVVPGRAFLHRLINSTIGIPFFCFVFFVIAGLGGSQTCPIEQFDHVMVAPAWDKLTPLGIQRIRRDNTAM